MDNFPSPLFNKKTIKRLTENIVPTSEQKEQATKWIEKIEKGELKGETDQYLNFCKYNSRQNFGL